MSTALLESAAALPEPVRAALRDLVLVLADSKRLLGFRYGGWLLGAPEVETGIACAAMAQDEWGHARLLYALLKDFGDDVEALEHGREPSEYASMEVLDREPEDWTGLVALNAFADTALTVQLEALRECRYAPLRQRTAKILAEEAFHGAHGLAWARRYARAQPTAASALGTTARQMMPPLLRWFGSEASTSPLADAGIVDAAGDELRRRFLQRLAPVLEELPFPLDADAPASAAGAFDERRRRPVDAAPDRETIVRVRGDRNRDFLVE